MCILARFWVGRIGALYTTRMLYMTCTLYVTLQCPIGLLNELEEGERRLFGEVSWLPVVKVLAFSARTVR